MLFVCVCFTECLLVKTGNMKNAQGYLEVKVNGEIVSSTGDAKQFDKGEVVVHRCFESLDKVEIRGPNGNGWGGSISAKISGSDSYQPFSVCDKCEPGNASAAQAIVVDGDGNSAIYGKTTCMDGNTCELRFPSGL